MNAAGDFAIGNTTANAVNVCKVTMECRIVFQLRFATWVGTAHRPLRGLQVDLLEVLLKVAPVHPGEQPRASGQLFITEAERAGVGADSRKAVKNVAALPQANGLWDMRLAMFFP